MKKQIHLFISYSHRNQDLADKFSRKFEEYITPSKHFEYIFWSDADLNAGDNWNRKIHENLNKSECGILLLSPAFLTSRYIFDVELPALLKEGKLVIPVALQKINFKYHDLHGLEEYQIYRFRDEGFAAPRSYQEVKEKRREDFINGLFEQMERQLLEKYKI